MGTNLKSQSQTVAYVQASDRLQQIINTRIGAPWYWPDFLHNLIGHGREQDRLVKTLHDFTNSVITERLRSFDQKKAEIVCQKMDTENSNNVSSKKNSNLAFLDMLLYMSDNLTKLSMDDIREEVDTFMFEGHDTIAVTTNWAIHLIGAHPQVQATLHKELEVIFGDSDRDVTDADIKEMRYMECCIKESLRVLPTSPSLGRKLVEDLVLGDHTIPKGTTAAIFTAGSCFDPENFPEPHEFRPERFFPENTKNRNPFSFIPFSAGPRNCIGQRFAMMEMKTILTYIFRNFEVKSCQRRDELRPTGHVTLRPENGILVQLTKH